MELSRKRQRIGSKKDVTQNSKPDHNRCHLSRMPLELLAEILSYTRSPRDILTFARTSKQFCTTLVNCKSTEFIWRQARARAPPSPIPDPTPDFTEAAYAAFLFDSKRCEVCQSKTRRMYHSFALRAVVCDDQCRESWRANSLHQVTIDDRSAYPDILLWIARLERTDEPYSSTKTYVRNSDWNEAINEHKKVHILGSPALEKYCQEKQALAAALPAKHQLCKDLLNWSTPYEDLQKKVIQTNQSHATSRAQSHRWPIKDLLHAPSYRSLHDARNRSLEFMTEEDFESIEGLIPVEMEANKARAARRKNSHALQERSAEVKDTWFTLKHTQEAEKPSIVSMPTVEEFRQLSVIKIYERSGADTKCSLSDPFVASVLADNLAQWRITVRASLAAVLGFPRWKNMSKKKLHPVDRLTARFRCQTCDKVSSENKIALDDGGMDFAEVCKHVCGHLRKKNRGKWNADRFVPDQRAIGAISQVLSDCGIISDDCHSLRLAQEVGDRIQCQICFCIMDVLSVARHCKRHVDCGFRVLPLNHTSSSLPIEHGLTEELKKNTFESARARDLKLYGCRLCAWAAAERAITNDKRLHKMFSFNGLRSHLKEKHSIIRVADEDFFRQKDTATDASTINSDA